MSSVTLSPWLYSRAPSRGSPPQITPPPLSRTVIRRCLNMLWFGPGPTSRCFINSPIVHVLTVGINNVTIKTSSAIGPSGNHGAPYLVWMTIPISRGRKLGSLNSWYCSLKWFHESNLCTSCRLLVKVLLGKILPYISAKITNWSCHKNYIFVHIVYTVIQIDNRFLLSSSHIS